MILFEWILILLFAAVVLTAAAERLRVPYPSLLAIAGAGIAFLPFAPVIRIEPDLALALFVAPALLDAAFDTSPQELRRNALPVISLAVFAVVFTTAAVAFVGWRFAGLPIAAAVALGAIVAPPDAAAAAAVLKELRLPQRIGAILQGESLLNDATALLIYRAAVAMAVGSFSLASDGPLILLSAAGSLGAGYILARLYLVLTSRLHDAASSTVLQFVSTFAVWLVAERLTLSPIITVVIYAMALAQAVPRRSSARLRVSSYSVWETAIFVVNVLAFVLMGLQARHIIERLSEAERWGSLLVGLSVLGIVIATRIAWIAAYRLIVEFGAILVSRRPGNARSPGRHIGVLERHAGPRHPGHRLRLAFGLSRPRSDRALRFLRRPRNAGDPGPYATATPVLAGFQGRRHGRAGAVGGAGFDHAGGAR